MLLHTNRLSIDETGVVHSVPGGGRSGARVDSRRTADDRTPNMPEFRKQMPYDSFLDELRGCRTLDHQYNKKKKQSGYLFPTGDPDQFRR